jgi:4-hydroxybutyrate CoA-transferase
MDYGYSQKVVSAEEALKHIKNGSKIILAHAAAEPRFLTDKLIEMKEDFEGLEFSTLVTLADCAYTQEGMAPHFRGNYFFASAGNRKPIEENNADYTPAFFYEVPDIFSDRLKASVALVQVTPPDKHGWCSLGISADFTKTSVERAELVIAQVNKNMPRTFGDTSVHVRDIDFFVEHDEPIKEYIGGQVTETALKIGENIASLIKDGDVLQLGIGVIPDAALSFLKDKKDLGLHSEMISDGVVELLEKGVINNERKQIDRGKSVTTFLMGSKKIYDFVDDNPSIILKTVDYTNDPRIISQNDNMVAINSCIELDFMGQVASESFGRRQYSGTGGQVDFVRGANMSKGGRAIIAIPSTAAKGTVSRIVPQLGAGAIITTSRNDVDYIITEYGIAQLKGKTLRQRAAELISISHPDFRQELKKEYDKIFNR